MRWIWLVSLALVLPTLATAQTPTHLWSGTLWQAQDPPSENYVFVAGLATDSSDNLIVAGGFAGAVDFGGGTPLSPSGGFLAKYDSDGVHQWSFAIGGGSLFDLAVDGSDEIYLVQGLSLRKFDSNGAPQWDRSPGFGEIIAMAVNPSGDAVLVGSAYGAPNVAKFSSDGTLQWTMNVGETHLEVAIGALGNVFIVGSISDPFYDLGAGLIPTDENLLYIAKYDSNGAHQWDHVISAVHTWLHYPVYIASDVDASGDYFVTMYFYGTTNFGGDDLVSHGYADMLLAKFDADGTHLWSTSFGGSDPDEYENAEDFAYDLRVDGEGNVLLTGQFNGPVNFGGGPINSTGLSDMFAAKFDGDGLHQWSQGFGDLCDESSRGGFGEEIGNSIAADTGGDVWVSTYMYHGGFIDFGGGAFGIECFWSGSQSFIAKFAAEAAAPTTVVGSMSRRVQLSSAYPDPFNPSTTITYALAQPGHVELAVYDVAGRHVRTLLDAHVSAGDHKVQWNGRDDAGSRVASGVYLYRLRAGDFVETKTMVLLK